MFRLSTQRLFAASAPALYPTGRVMSWMAGRGFGFIESDDDKKQHFVHFSAVKVEAGGFRALQVDQRVEFQIVEQDGRTRAENVTAPGGAPLPSGPRPEGFQNNRGGRGRGGFRGGRGRGGNGGGRGNNGGSEEF
jgi:cold shock CspA family protein